MIHLTTVYMISKITINATVVSVFKKSISRGMFADLVLYDTIIRGANVKIPTDYGQERLVV